MPDLPTSHLKNLISVMTGRGRQVLFVVCSNFTHTGVECYLLAYSCIQGRILFATGILLVSLRPKVAIRAGQIVDLKGHFTGQSASPNRNCVPSHTG